MNELKEYNPFPVCPKCRNGERTDPKQRVDVTEKGREPEFIGDGPVFHEGYRVRWMWLCDPSQALAGREERIGETVEMECLRCHFVLRFLPANHEEKTP